MIRIMMQIYIMIRIGNILGPTPLAARLCHVETFRLWWLNVPHHTQKNVLLNNVNKYTEVT